ncbi:signal recognition particle-docking protein FtsY, partial [Nocardiopsis sp. MG754419]|nr:signal recognition particle-docking protein FtsY [Nocardiopsis sp. MG754419]
MDITLLVSIIVVVALLVVGGFFLVKTRSSVRPGKEETGPEDTEATKEAAPEEDRERDEGTVRTPPAHA